MAKLAIRGYIKSNNVINKKNKGAHNFDYMSQNYQACFELKFNRDFFVKNSLMHFLFHCLLVVLESFWSNATGKKAYAN